MSLESPLLDRELGGFGVAVALYGGAFTLRTPDFTYDLDRPRHVLWCSGVGLAIPLAAFAAAGAALQAATGTWNLADVLLDLGVPTLAYPLLAVVFLGSVLTNLHSGALSLTDVSGRSSHALGLALVRVIGGALAALGFADTMPICLVLMAVVAPSAIVLA